MSSDGNLAAEERQAHLRASLDSDGRIRIGAAASDLQVSEMTIRRDLQELEAMGVARRVRGGAIAVGPAPFADRHRRGARAKAAIAEKCLALLPGDGAVGFDASSTLVRLAGAVASARDLVVVTNGPETFDALQRTPGVTALLTGGELDERTGSLVGPFAVRAAGQLMLSRLFVSAAGVDPALGASEPSLEEAEVKRALAAMAGEVVLCVDSSKLGARAVALSLEWEQVEVLVTELAPTDARLSQYRDLVPTII